MEGSTKQYSYIAVGIVLNFYSLSNAQTYRSTVWVYEYTEYSYIYSVMVEASAKQEGIAKFLWAMQRSGCVRLLRDSKLTELGDHNWVMSSELWSDWKHTKWNWKP